MRLDIIMLQDHLTPTDAVPSPTSAQSKSPVEVKGTEASDNGYNSVPVANLISESLQKNITDVQQQLGDIFYPSPEEPTTELPLTYSTTTSTYQLPGESSTTTLPPEDKTPPEPAVTAPPVTPAPTNGRIKTLFGPRNSPYQGIIIDSSFTMTFPRDSSTPTSLPSAPKGSNSASQKFETSSNVQNPPSLFDAQLPTRQSESNFDVQKQSQRSASTYNGKAKTQERNSNSQIRTHDFQSSFNTRKTSRKTSSSTARSRSGFYSQQGAKTSKSNKPKPSNSIKTLFEVPYLFDYMKSPFPNEDAGVKHRFLKPKTAQGADKPFETAGSLPVPVATVTAASIARTVKDAKPSTPASNRKYDPATGKTRSNPKRKTKKKTMNVATANGKPKIDKVVPTAGSGIKTVTERRGIPINANFMEHLPFFVGAVDSKLFQGMQLLGGGGVGPGQSQVSARKTNSRSTTTPVAVARSTRSTSLPTTKASPKKLEYDLKVLCMQFLRWNTNNHMYIPHPGDCSKIIQCTPEGNEMHAAARHCPLGLFWDPNTQRCSDPGDVTCFDDPCQKGYYNYTSHGGCGTYYSCLGGVSVPTCCPSGYRFVQTTKDSGNCIWDTSCSEPCETLQSSRLRKTGACPALEVEARTDAYWILQRGSLILKTCPEGSVYNHKECKCKSTTAPTMPSRPSSARDSTQKCSPEFKLTFDGGIVKDVSGGGLAFSQVNVAGTDNNTAIFRENGYISLWGFQNRYLGRTFSIRMRLRADKGSCRSSARSIVSNCGPDGPTSVEIACDNNNVAFKANTDNRKVPTVVRRTIKDNEWTDIIYTYKGNKFSGSVNERKFSKSLTGNLVSRNNPLIIGKCPKSPGFIGEIDQLEIYTHCVP
ncbi:uncharacterized protein [Argopecten irradians]|uniref:uncharacterized protein n=1 Tax=Argopecten irradians TaxID=31199 RepID=UPI00371599B8